MSKNSADNNNNNNNDNDNDVNIIDDNDVNIIGDTPNDSRLIPLKNWIIIIMAIIKCLSICLGDYCLHLTSFNIFEEKVSILF
jgi:hypothetical protein